MEIVVALRVKQVNKTARSRMQLAQGGFGSTCDDAYKVTVNTFKHVLERIDWI